MRQPHVHFTYMTPLSVNLTSKVHQSRLWHIRFCRQSPKVPERQTPFQTCHIRLWHCGSGADWSRWQTWVFRLGNRLIKDEESCSQMSYEDLDVFKCLKQVSVFAEKPLDEVGRERFHQDSLLHYYMQRTFSSRNIYFTTWLIKKKESRVLWSLNISCCLIRFGDEGKMV